MLEPLKPVSRSTRIVLGTAFFVLFLAAWALATFGGFIDPMFLKDPWYTLATGWTLFTEYAFIEDIGITIFRVVCGFVIAAIVAVPLGIAMGAFKSIEALFEPFISFARYLPASAFIPLRADASGIVTRVMLPGAAPQITEALRLVLGWAWTYVIVAELVGASSGIGHMIMDSQRLLDTGQMIFGIFTIGVIGLVTDFSFKWVNRKLYPWAF